MRFLSRKLAPFAAASPPLVGIFVAMVVLTAGALAGLLFDTRVITGAPAWLKPLKFAVSAGVYALGFAWLLGHVRGSSRLVRVASWVTAVTLGVELSLIFLQAARGVMSHFNQATPFDAAVFHTMGLAITILWICQIVVTVVLLRQPFEDRALGLSLGWGMAMTTLGAGVGFLMVVPPDLSQIPTAAIVGSHTVGAPDGGAGLWLTNWSRDHGDLRVPHFVGLHALQILPLVGWALGRTSIGRDPKAREALVRVAGASYLGLFVLLLVQALRGRSVISLDPMSVASLVTWSLCTALGAALALAAERIAPQAAQEVSS
jgi:hypothetical protein